MPKIINLSARAIPDSRDNPTVAVVIELAGGKTGEGLVPSGASTGSHEALVLPVPQALENIEQIIKPALINQDFDQKSLDQRLLDLDGTENKAHLGANAILGVSLAFARAAASAEGKSLYQYFSELGGGGEQFSLPLPMMNILNGGRHVRPSEGGGFPTDIQEFMIVPVGATSFIDRLVWGKKVFATLKDILTAKGLSTDLGDEGGFAPALKSNTEALDLIILAITQAGYEPGQQIAIAVDVAASEFFSNNIYNLKLDNKTLSSDEMIVWYEELIAKYPIISIEDGLAEDDWLGWQKLTARLGHRVQLVGDDLFVTNIKMLQKGIEEKVANTILIKPNQIGTVSETVAAVELARSADYKCIISHRSGETLDSTIADLAVGLRAQQIKSGAPSRPERLAKYDRLVAIEEDLQII